MQGTQKEGNKGIGSCESDRVKHLLDCACLSSCFRRWDDRERFFFTFENRPTNTREHIQKAPSQEDGHNIGKL